MEVTKTKKTPETRDTSGGVPKLPLDLIYMVFEHWPLDKIFPLVKIRAMKDILIAKLHGETFLDSWQLEYISKHPEVHARLKKLKVYCGLREDVALLESVCKWCSNLQDISLQLNNFSMTHLKECPHILERMTELWIETATMEDFLFINDVCERYPTKLRKMLILSMAGEMTQPLSQFPEILRRLTHLGVNYPDTDMSSIKAICRQYPVKLCLRAELNVVNENPSILKSLDQLTVEIIEHEELTLLDDICRRSPNLSGVRIDIIGGLQKLLTCSHVFASLDSLAVRVSHEDDIVLLKELFQQCPKLDIYRVSAPRHFFKRLANEELARNLGKSLLMFRDRLSVSSESPGRLVIICDFQHINDIAGYTDLEALTDLNLTLNDDEIADDIAKYFLLEDISLRSPSLKRLTIDLRSARSSDQLAEILGKAMKNWKSLHELFVACSPQIEMMLRRKWTDAGFDLARIAKWEIETE